MWLTDWAKDYWDSWNIGDMWSGAMDKIGEVLGTSNTAEVERAKDALSEIMGYGESTAALNRALFGDYMGQMQKMYGGGASQYDQAVQNLAAAMQAQSQRDPFEYTGDVTEYYDPAANQRAMAAQRAIENAAASGGSRFSSSYLDKQAAKQQALASEEWRNAYDRLMQARNQQLQQYQAQQAASQQNIQNLGTLASAYGQEKGQLANAIGDYYTAMAGQNQANLEMQSDLAQNRANVELAHQHGIGGLLGSLGGAVGSIISASA